MMVFCSVKPLIDNNRKRRENGKKGGRKPAVAEMDPYRVNYAVGYVPFPASFSVHQDTVIPRSKSY